MVPSAARVLNRSPQDDQSESESFFSRGPWGGLVPEVVLIFVVLALLMLSIVLFSKEKVDFVAFSIIAAVVSGLLLAHHAQLDLGGVFTVVEYEPLLFIFGMSVLAYIAEKERVFQALAVALIKATRGNERQLFYVICVVSTLSAAVIADVTVSIIFVPIIIRTCQILKIRAGTYLVGMTITINLGSLITPFSSGENILIASYFDLDLAFFLQNFSVLFALLLVSTLLLLDLLFLRKEERGPVENKQLLLEILNPALVISDKRRFLMNCLIIGTVFVTMMFVSQVYLVVLLGSMVLILANKIRFKEIFKNLEWDVLFFLVCLFVMIGALTAFGLFTFLGDLIVDLVRGNYFAAIFLVLILSSVLSAVLANTPTTLIFLPIVAAIIVDFAPLSPIPLYLALLIGVNLGGNFIPQGAACDMMTLELAKKAKVEDMSYRRLLKQGALFAFLHLGLSVLYLSGLAFLLQA